MHTASSIVGEVKGQGQGRAKGQIYLISYNFASILTIPLCLIATETSNLVHILAYEKLHQI